MKKKILWIIIPLAVAFLVFYWKETLIVLVSPFIDEGGRDSRPLHVIMKKNDVDIYRKFLETSEAKFTVYDLVSLASVDNPEFFNILLHEHGFDVNMEDLKLNTSALLLIADGFNYRGVKRLIGANANVNFTDLSGKTPLTTAISAYVGSDEGKQKEKYRIVKLLIDSGAELNPQNSSYLAPIPLSEALYKKNIEIVSLLIASGANVFHEDREGYNYFFYAYEPELARILFSQGLDINDTENRKGKSPLQSFIANDSYNLESIKFFIFKGADLCHTDIQGNNILDYAEKRGISLYDPKKVEFNAPKFEANRKTELYQFLAQEYKENCSEKIEL